MKRNGLEVFVDKDIRKGAEWGPDIMDALARCQAALLLVDIHSMNSGFIREIEFPYLERRAEWDRGFPIIPVYADYCAHEQWEGLERYQMLFKEHPVRAQENTNKGWTDVARALDRTLRQPVPYESTEREALDRLNPEKRGRDAYEYLISSSFDSEEVGRQPGPDIAVSCDPRDYDLAVGLALLLANSGISTQIWPRVSRDLLPTRAQCPRYRTEVRIQGECPPPTDHDLTVVDISIDEVWSAVKAGSLADVSTLHSLLAKSEEQT